jgi:hypothetical protein
MESPKLAAVNVEVCDGLSSHVESNLSYWVDTVGTFCPWSAYVDRELDSR